MLASEMVTTVDPPPDSGAKEDDNGATTTTPSSSPPASPSSTNGRLKAPPVCVDASLKEQALTASALSALAYAPSEIPPKPTFKTTLDAIPSSQPQPLPSLATEPIPVSSSSSTCTRESDLTLSDAEGHHLLHNNLAACNGNKSVSATTAASAATATAAATPQVKFDRGVTGRLNAKVSLRKTSRQGRSTQRWVTDPTTSEAVRLVTGCVPLLKGGKVLFVSSSRKPEWILPKGGWEQDEGMEESAVRECFEEAGVLGVLGPPLKDFQYETRKAKKRRLEKEEIQQKKLTAESETEREDDDCEKTTASNGDHADNAAAAASASSSAAVLAAAVASPISHEDISRIRGQAHENNYAHNKSSDETLSVASNLSGTYSQVRLTLFPLYVSEVHERWPECGRFRKAVDIDEAILMMESRPEFKTALEEVKERGLHLLF